ncbi:CCA tRNA nucleotidyltransferase [Anaeromyxobacter diazotrophicus]|uniref:HDIG domain-containing protein n=1 Tax=Anaeromyxobacter diazotrophicus TaxID=2590199 RepID=A0A7I9VL65_9BACT|nr:tRNA cytidylyltransferase [Anaeromyxobacter diazotrophicus]GEJ57153.1 HDIG domain-containing protein [Anaeromyxobacter diazotrophicus]
MTRRPSRVPAALRRARFAPAVLEVLRRLDAAGHRSWLVGGAVRDLLLRRRRLDPADLDVATPARPEQVSALFEKVIPTGVEHGTVTVLGPGGVPVEVTTFRGEGAYLDGRRPSSVVFLSEVDEDLSRRDFTVNALAYDPLGGELRDPFGGQDDLRRRRLRAVGDPAARFAEDGLRPLRAARFAAQLGFALDPATRRAIRPALAVTAKVSAERVMAELSKLLLAAHPAAGLALLDATGLLEVVLPELAVRPPAARRHAYEVVRRAPRELPLRLAALLHVLPRGGDPAGGAEAAARARQLLVRMRFPGAVAELAAALAAAQGCVLAAPRPAAPRSPAEVRRFVAGVGRERLAPLLALWEADASAARPPARSRRELATLRALRARIARVERTRPPLTSAELALDGRAVMEALGLAPGREVGEALRHLLERALEDPGLNTAEALTSELRTWWARRPGRAAPGAPG